MTARTPEYLSEEHEPQRRVRCPVHGFIRYSPVEQQIIDHEVFQRLRNVRQLALTHYVYPGAIHSRFEHSLGVMELAGQAFDVLLLKNADLLEGNFRSLEGFEQQALAKAHQLVRLMGLLHDVGHTAFSHAGELLPDGSKHESLSAWVVSTDGPLGKLLNQLFFEQCSQYLSLMLAEKDQVIPPQLWVIKHLISGELDLDRTDYLIRDSLHCGVEYGRFDYLRLIQSLIAHPHPDAPALAIGVDEGGFHAFESLILARYYMNTQVYYHRVRRAYDLLLRNWLQAWGLDHYSTPGGVLKYDDILLLAAMHNNSLTNATADTQELWAQRIVRRQHPRRIWELGDDADARHRRTAERIIAMVQDRFPKAELFLDDAEGNIHKLFVQGESEIIEDLFIVPRRGARVRLTERSSIIRTIPKKFRVVRVFGYFTSDSERNKAVDIAKGIEVV